MSMNTVKTHACFDGVQGYYNHESKSTKTAMDFAVFVPPGDGPFPVVWFLSGLTCTPDNVVVKAGMQRFAAEEGIVIVAPDTSPRGLDYAKDERYWFGEAASYYVDATAAPFADNYRMYTWLSAELPHVIAKHFPVDMKRQAITGHSMGGHGALMMALKQPERFCAASAFAPITSFSTCPWGEPTVEHYFGGDSKAAAQFDVVELLKAGARPGGPWLIDQGSADGFLEENLRPALLTSALDAAGVKHTSEIREGYDHSFFFVATYMPAHLRFLAEALLAG